MQKQAWPDVENRFETIVRDRSNSVPRPVIVPFPPMFPILRAERKKSFPPYKCYWIYL